MKYLLPCLLFSGPLFANDFAIDLQAHLNLTVGAADTVDERELAAHAHDPNDNFNLQGLELSASARYGAHLLGFANYNSFLDLDDKIDGEWEEAYLKLHELPGRFELRAGRLQNRITSQNDQHLHSWNFVDANLITSRFLGDEGLLTNSAELSWWLPFEHDSILSVAFGDAIEHEHEHEEDDHHEEEVHGEDSLPVDDVLSIRLKGIYKLSDFHQFTYGASFLHGTNSFEKTSESYSADLQHLWREQGIEAGGKHFRSTLELAYRSFDYHSEDHSQNGDAGEWALHSSIGWGFCESWELGLRYDFLEGVNPPVEELAERHRLSVALTRQFTVSEQLDGHLRLQYNHDDSKDFGTEDAIWLQCQLNLGTQAGTH